MEADAGNLAAGGLSSREAEQRKAAGLSNAVRESGRKTIGQIIASNVLTLFNLVNVLIFILILTTGYYRNTLFMGVVISNTLIGIIEEIKARRIIESLRIITAQAAVVLRDRAETKILPEDIVLDDVFLLRPGSQVCADGQVLASEGLEVDESLLTGEAEPVRKQAGDQVLSGSFVVAGRGSARVMRVGQQSFAQNITLEAHRYKRARSEILVNLNRIIRVVSILIVPVGLLLFGSQFFRAGAAWDEAVVSSAAGIIGMIPEGLVLLTSITLTVGIIKLARKRAIVQELAGLEVLARVDCLCLDKTGTLTRGVLEVADFVLLDPADASMPQQAAAALSQAFPDQNSTSQAIARAFPGVPAWEIRHIVPFASARMWSGATFAGEGSWLFGAPDHLLGPEHAALLARAAALAAAGNRVVLLASTPQPLAETILPQQIQPRALILLSDAIRPEAKAALEYFAQNDVEIKIITGDSPLTAAAVAEQLGLGGSGHSLDMSQFAGDPTDLAAAAGHHTIFGRVSPAQKKQLIRALQQSGRVVAMVGDGTNDVLAMHQADCSIVMASGSPAAKAMAHIALLDSDFTVLPAVVSEGRQVINNVERVASLYLVKTTYSMLLSLFFILAGAPYVFYPIHLTLLGMVSIGIPSFFLAMEKNIRRIQPGFLGKIIRTAVPGGAAIALNLILWHFLQAKMPFDESQGRLVAVLMTGLAGLLVLLRISLPLNRLRLILLAAMAALFLTALLLFPGLLYLPAADARSFLVACAFAAWVYPLILILERLLGRATKMRESPGHAKHS